LDGLFERVSALEADNGAAKNDNTSMRNRVAALEKEIVYRPGYLLLIERGRAKYFELHGRSFLPLPEKGKYGQFTTVYRLTF
jgi:hypothetical protein